MFPFPHQDPDEMTLQMVAERVQMLILYSLAGYLDKCTENGAVLDVDELVKDISDEIYKSKGTRKKYFSGKIYKANLDKPTKAFLTNKITFKKIGKYKNSLMNRYRAKTLKLDPQTMAVWFIADVLNRAFDLHWHFVVVAVLKILFIYDYASARKVRDLLEPLQFHHFHPDDEKLRKWKSKTIDEIRIWFGNEIVNVTEDKVGSKWENHFERPASSQQNFELAVECMELQSLYRHSCVLDGETELKSPADVAKRLKEQNISDADGIERMFMHLLSCPRDLFALLTAMGVAIDFDQKLGIPLFMLARNGGGQGPIPQGRTDIIKHYLGRKIDIEEELRRRDMRRNNVKLDHVLIAIDDVVRAKIFLDEAKTLKLLLKPGESLLAVRAEDDLGSLPLEVRHVPWGLDLSDVQAYKFCTKLKDGKKLKFKVTYQQNEAGELSGATMEILYVPKRKISQWLGDELGESGRLAFPTARTLVKTGAGVLLALGGLLAIWCWSGASIEPQKIADFASVGTSIAPVDSNDKISNTNNSNTVDTKENTSPAKPPWHEGSPKLSPHKSKKELRHPDPTLHTTKAGKPAGTNASPNVARSRSRRFLDPIVKAAKRIGRFLSKHDTHSDSEPGVFPTVIVTDQNHRRIASAMVFFKTPGRQTKNAEFISHGEVLGVCDDEGEFTYTVEENSLGGVNRTIYDLIVKKPGFATARQNRIRVSQGSTRLIHVRLVPEVKSKHYVADQLRNDAKRQ